MDITEKKKTGIDEAMDDIRNGRVKEYGSAEELFNDLGIWIFIPLIQADLEIRLNAGFTANK